MARLRIDGDDLVVALRPWERLATGRSRVRVPLDSVTAVEARVEPWRCLRGERERGLAIPDVVWLGLWRHDFGRDLVAVRPRRGPCVQVELRLSAEFARIALTVPAPDAVADRIRAAMDRTAV